MKSIFKDVDPVWLLFLGIIIFAGMLFASEIFFKDDSQFFQVIASALSLFVGAFLAIIKAKAGMNGAPPPPAPAPVAPPPKE